MKEVEAVVGACAPWRLRAFSATEGTEDAEKKASCVHGKGMRMAADGHGKE